MTSNKKQTLILGIFLCGFIPEAYAMFGGYGNWDRAFAEKKANTRIAMEIISSNNMGWLNTYLAEHGLHALGDHPLYAVVECSFASRAHKVAVAKLLLKRGVNIDAYPEKCRSPIESAVSDNNVPLTHLLLERKAKFTKYGQNSLLNLAAIRRNKEMITLLLNHGAPPTPAAAVILQDRELLKTSLREKASADDLAYCCYPLDLALSINDGEMAREVLKLGACPTACAAAILNDAELLEKIPQQESDSDYDEDLDDEEKAPARQDVNGKIDFLHKENVSALQIALMLGHTEVARGLIKLGAKIDGITYIQNAITKGDVQALLVLDEAQVHFTQIDDEARTFLIFALQNLESESLLDVVNFLLKKRVNLAQRDRLGNTAAHYAAMLHARLRTQVHKVLLEVGAPMDLPNNEGKIARFPVEQEDDDSITEEDY